uniref:Uncharacterized protein n=1 Tax=Ciona savignyi TaxID=51511 RepID=H2ZMM5_CIOSA
MKTSESTSLSEDILFLSSLYDIKFTENNEENCSNENDPLYFVIGFDEYSVQFCYSVSEDSLQAHVSMNDSQEGLEEMQQSVNQLVAVASIHWTKRVCSAIDQCKDYLQTMEDSVVQPTEDTCGHPGPAHASPQLTSSSQSVCPRGGKGKKPPMKTALDVINR